MTMTIALHFLFQYSKKLEDPHFFALSLHWLDDDVSSTYTSIRSESNNDDAFFFTWFCFLSNFPQASVNELWSFWCNDIGVLREYKCRHWPIHSSSYINTCICSVDCSAKWTEHWFFIDIHHFIYHKQNTFGIAMWLKHTHACLHIQKIHVNVCIIPNYR